MEVFFFCTNLVLLNDIDKMCSTNKVTALGADNINLTVDTGVCPCPYSREALQFFLL